MSRNEINNDRIYIKLKNEITDCQSTYILVEKFLAAAEDVNCDMPVFLQSPAGQAAFRNVVEKLVFEQLIAPVGNKPNTISGLYQKYRVNKKLKQKNSELVAQIIKSILPPATLDYYIKNPQDFINDQAIIEAISNFLSQKHKDIITVNERAYELFGDEKFFKGTGQSRSRGEIVLKRLGLSWLSIGCQETIEPFFSFHKKNFHLRTARKIYIIENKDTFWSFKQNIMDCLSSITVDMLVYGEGRKIISSFRFMEEYDLNPQIDKFFYFGDLDPEGINIYCELVDEYPQYKIVPFVVGYQAVLAIGQSKPSLKTPKQQKIKLENIKRFIENFDQPQAVKLKSHLEGGFYIPQEALSATQMKERFGSITNA
ncbi:hypothetical protein SRRS_44920 [Sporomusa rhizae]|uniref:Wadjet anti-phage system protein JetD domain-containing protein n=1 Tax=Sporomusa rhizae TaxID=357999 RepID=UPI00352B32B3